MSSLTLEDVLSDLAASDYSKECKQQEQDVSNTAVNGTTTKTGAAISGSADETRARMAALVGREFNQSKQELDYQWAERFSESLASVSQLQQQGSEVSESLSR